MNNEGSDGVAALDESFVTAQAPSAFDQTEIADENDTTVAHPRDTYIGKQSFYERKHRDVLRYIGDHHALSLDSVNS